MKGILKKPTNSVNSVSKKNVKFNPDTNNEQTNLSVTHEYKKQFSSDVLPIIEKLLATHAEYQANLNSFLHAEYQQLFHDAIIADLEAQYLEETQKTGTLLIFSSELPNDKTVRDCYLLVKAQLYYCDNTGESQSLTINQRSNFTRALITIWEKEEDYTVILTTTQIKDLIISHLKAPHKPLPVESSTTKRPLLFRHELVEGAKLENCYVLVSGTQLYYFDEKNKKHPISISDMTSFTNHLISIWQERNDEIPLNTSEINSLITLNTEEQHTYHSPENLLEKDKNTINHDNFNTAITFFCDQKFAALEEKIFLNYVEDCLKALLSLPRFIKYQQLSEKAKISTFTDLLERANTPRYLDVLRKIFNDRQNFPSAGSVTNAASLDQAMREKLESVLGFALNEFRTSNPAENSSSSISIESEVIENTSVLSLAAANDAGLHLQQFIFNHWNQLIEEITENVLLSVKDYSERFDGTNFYQYVIDYVTSKLELTIQDLINQLVLNPDIKQEISRITLALQSDPTDIKEREKLANQWESIRPNFQTLFLSKNIIKTHVEDFFMLDINLKTSILHDKKRNQYRPIKSIYEECDNQKIFFNVEISPVIQELIEQSEEFQINSSTRLYAQAFNFVTKQFIENYSLRKYNNVILSKNVVLPKAEEKNPDKAIYLAPNSQQDGNLTFYIYENNDWYQGELAAGEYPKKIADCLADINANNSVIKFTAPALVDNITRLCGCSQKMNPEEVKEELNGYVSKFFNTYDHKRINILFADCIEAYYPDASKNALSIISDLATPSLLSRVFELYNNYNYPNDIENFPSIITALGHPNFDGLQKNSEKNVGITQFLIETYIQLTLDNYFSTFFTNTVAPAIAAKGLGTTEEEITTVCKINTAYLYQANKQGKLDETLTNLIENSNLLEAHFNSKYSANPLEKEIITYVKYVYLPQMNKQINEYSVKLLIGNARMACSRIENINTALDTYLHEAKEKYGANNKIYQQKSLVINALKHTLNDPTKALPIRINNFNQQATRPYVKFIVESHQDTAGKVLLKTIANYCTFGLAHLIVHKRFGFKPWLAGLKQWNAKSQQLLASATEQLQPFAPPPANNLLMAHV